MRAGNPCDAIHSGGPWSDLRSACALPPNLFFGSSPLSNSPAFIAARMRAQKRAWRFSRQQARSSAGKRRRNGGAAGDGIAPNIAANVAIVVLQAAQRALMSRRPIMRAGVGRRQRPERLSRSRPSIATLSP